MHSFWLDNKYNFVFLKQTQIDYINITNYEHIQIVETMRNQIGDDTKRWVSIGSQVTGPILYKLL